MNRWVLFSTMKQSLSPLKGDWVELLNSEFEKSYMHDLQKFLLSEKEAEKIFYPPEPDIFNALNETSFSNIKIVILGQDPYHGDGQAHGLSFSVKSGIKPPPSLINIFKELEREYEKPMPRNGDLTGWAKQGVLLLNATLTVQQGNAGSHQRRGWEAFTDKVIDLINRDKSGVVFMLWGSHAQKKGALIDRAKHLVLEAPHPSPLSAHRGFLGCNHFLMANEYLQRQGIKPVDWFDK